ncbi:helix-turn-helix domain-containing protein [Embleya sp. NBC_00896]|uniref:helix-turn-helix domain-containing protein n=1 Tax=Embleya sp. NBC_00896 TaxID=2975961 RepID=UPI00386A5811|nr:helix-turn-helix domain-containing protein [Embleya sp. NBC_00896]
MPAQPGPSVRRRQLGATLRSLRETAGITAEEAAVVLDCHASKLSRLENGRSGVRPRDVRDLLSRYGVDDEGLRTALEALARTSYQRGWWHQYSGTLDQEHTDFIGLEATASSVRNFQPLLIPGLLQTEDYLTAIIESHHIQDTPEQVAARVAVRTARQEVLTRAQNPLSLWVVVHEAAVRHVVGGREVMRAQIQHIREWAAVPNVTVQVLPFAAGAHAGMHGPFAIVSFPALAALDVVYIENLTSSLYVEEPEQVQTYTGGFDHLRAAALAPKESLAFLAHLGKDL